MTQKIEIKLVSDGSAANKAQDVLQAKVAELGRSYEQAGKASVRAASAARGSYQQLEQELKDNVRELKRMEIGSKEFDRQKQKVAGLARELNKARTAVGGVANQGSRLNTLATGVASKVAGVAAGFVSINTAIAAIGAEFEKVKRNQLQAAAQTRSFEESLADIAFNVGGKDLDATRKLVEENAVKLGTSQEGLANLIGLAVSAGAKDIEQALKVATASLEATAGDASKATELVQSALDISSLAGSDNFRGALGQVSQTQSQVRAINASEFFSNLGPALAAATANRTNIDAISTERTLELSSVVSQIIKDRTGANTATAVRQFVTRLDSFAPELSKTLKDGSKAAVSQNVINAFKSSRSVDERVELFRQNEGLRRQFLDAQKEGIGKSAIAEIVGGTKRARELEQKAAENITSIDKAEGAFADLVEAVDRNTVVLQAERKSQAAIQATRTQGAQALEGQARKIIEDALAEVDLPGADFIQQKAVEADLKLAADRGENIAEVGQRILDASKGDDLGVLDFWKRRLDQQERVIIESAKQQLEELATRIDVARQEQLLEEQNELLGKLVNNQNAGEQPVPVRLVGQAPVEAPTAAAGVP